VTAGNNCLKAQLFH